MGFVHRSGWKSKGGFGYSPDHSEGDLPLPVKFMAKLLRILLEVVLFAVGCFAGVLKGLFFVGAVGIGVFAIFLLHAITNRPPPQLARVRQVLLAEVAGRFFAKLRQNVRIGPGQRFPVRISVFVRDGLLIWSRFKMVMHHEFRPDDSDWGMCWPWRQGLCWLSFRNRKAEFWRKGQRLAGLHVDDHNAARTKGVEAVLSIPLKALRPGEVEPDDSIVAIVAFDALNTSAADELEALWNNYRTGNAPELNELLSAMSRCF